MKKIAVALLLVSMFAVLGCGVPDDKSTKWQLVSEGVFERVEYVGNGCVPFIYYSDGRTTQLWGQSATGTSDDISFPRGSKIRIYQDSIDYYKIKVVRAEKPEAK